MAKAQLWERIHDSVRQRMTPSLIIIGAQKAGTTSLYLMLKQFPKVLAPEIKELNHFNRDAEYEKGMKHYRSHFPLKPLWGSGYVAFEASPSYLFESEVCAERIARHLPHATCLAILRDPVKRAYSAWNMFRDFKDDPRYGQWYDPRSFQQAVEEEIAGRTRIKYHQHLRRSQYAGQIQDFKSRIAPDRLMVERYRDLQDDPARFLARICRRIGVTPLPPEHRVFHVRANVRPYPEPIDKGLARELYAYFKPDMDRLQQVLGYDIDIMEGN